ncbi:class I adenylate-forming enzyme family protein [Caballeronia sp. 15715]|uniref:class I adenylate-forming enzyme family protein n=1 Tax=unclassified Caballeronia TaxID=2646786 RepID=UPI0039E4BDAC
MTLEVEGGPLRNSDISFCNAVQSMPDRVAVSDSTRETTWNELDHRANQIARKLIDRGVRPDDKVAVLSLNSVNYVEVMFGILRAGACIVPLPTHTSIGTWSAMLKDCGTRLLFASADYASNVESTVDVVQLDEATLSEFVSGADTTPPEVAGSLDHGFNLIYSSGTTGVPKGILQSRRYRANEAQVIAHGYSLNHATRTLVSTPLCSNTTLFVLFAVMFAGGSVKLMEKFDAGRWLALAEQWRPTDVILVPVQYTRLLAHSEFDRFDLSSFRNKFCTSAPLSAATKQQILSRWPAGGLTEFYGMTEGGVSCYLNAHERPDKLDTVGKPFPDCNLRVIDNDGRVLKQGEVGEIIGRSPRLMTGYYKLDDATREASWFDEAGTRFQRSGDIGWVDDDGFVHLLDRKKDVIITGGFNVYAVDLEAVLLEHQDVLEAAVIAAPSKRWGETPVAFAVLRTDASPDAVCEWANQQLGKVQRLARVIGIKELPRSNIGKVLKRTLREELVPWGVFP